MTELILETKKTSNDEFTFSTSIPYSIYCLVSDFMGRLQVDTSIKESEGRILQNNEVYDVHMLKVGSGAAYLTKPAIRPGSNVLYQFKFKGTQYTMDLLSYIEQGELHASVHLAKEKIDNKSLKSIWNSIEKQSMLQSELRGNVIEFKKLESFSYKIIDSTNFPTLDDVFVHPDVKLELDVYIKQWDTMGAFYRYLLNGEPGTGKTESILAISKHVLEKNVTVFKTTIDQNFKLLVELAEKLSPSIILLDDIDLSLGSRTEGGVHSNNLQMFLDILDGVHKLNANVGFIATTNASNLIDGAASRPGRFDKIIEYGFINEEIVIELIKKSLNNFLTSEEREKWAPIILHPDIIDCLLDYDKSTGSHVYNKIRLTCDRIRIGVLAANTNDIVEYIKKDTKLSIEAQKNHTHKRRKNIGFNNNISSTNDDIDIESLIKKALQTLK